MSNKVWNEAEILRLINDGEEESSTLEYKSASALDKATPKKKEIAKDVSAMANSAGGVIIYGISEFQEEGKLHLPEKIDPVNRTYISKEWLDQVISANIQPAIRGLLIHPVGLHSGPNDVVYVVEVPQGITAHQVTTDKDYRYYQRFNFTTVAVEDFMVRLLMSRAIIPDVSVEFDFHTISRTPEEHEYRLEVLVRNEGEQVVNNFKIEFIFPRRVKTRNFFSRESDIIVSSGDRNNYLILYRSKGVLFPLDEVNVGNEINWCYYVNNDIHWIEDTLKVDWVLYADNMMPKRGTVPFSKLHNF